MVTWEEMAVGYSYRQGEGWKETSEEFELRLARTCAQFPVVGGQGQFKLCWF